MSIVLATQEVEGDPWTEAKLVMGQRRLLLGPQGTYQFLYKPDHLAMVLARYRAAAALIGEARWVKEIGCGEGLGAGILAFKRPSYLGIDTDAEAVGYAEEMYRDWTNMRFTVGDGADVDVIGDGADAVVSLDVIEHVPVEHEQAFMHAIVGSLSRGGVCVIGTPNAAFEHLASPASKAGHVNLYTNDRLSALMNTYFTVVQSFGMQDTSLHLGHPEARHYLMLSGVGLR